MNAEAPKQRKRKPAGRQRMRLRKLLAVHYANVLSVASLEKKPLTFKYFFKKISEEPILQKT